MTQGNTSLRMAALLSAVAITVFVISAVLYLNTQQQPLDDFMPWIVGWCGPTIPALLGYALLDRKLEAVHREVNGNTTNLINQNRNLTGKVGDQVDEITALKEQLASLVSRIDAAEGRQPQ